MNNKFKKVMLFSALVWIVTNFHHPVTPSHFTGLGLPSHIFGTSYAAMVFVTFITSPMWGSWADQNSRITTLTLSAIIYGISQIGFALVDNMFGILVFRGLAGVANGGYSVGLMSAVVDTSPESKVEVNIANYSALMSVCMALGFLGGGILGYFQPKTVFLIQGVLMILIGFGFKFIVGETNEHNRHKHDSKPTYIWDIVKDAKSSKKIFAFWIIIFLAITFFTEIAKSSNNNALNYYMKAQLDLKPIVNGLWKAITGILGLVTNLTINVWIIKKKDVKNSLVGLLFLTTISAFMIVVSESFYPFMLWNLLFVTLHTIQVPILQNFAVSGNSQDIGLMSGIYNAMKSLGAMFGSIIAGFVYDINSKLPFVISAVAFAIAFVFSLIDYFVKVEEME